MNPVQTHLESEGIDITVDDAVDVRLRQHIDGDGVLPEMTRSFYRAIINIALREADAAPEVPE